MTLREAVANLIKVKGRHNTEIAYQKLIEAFDADKPIYCGCGDQIMPNDNAECGNCVTARNAVKPDLAQVGEVGVWGERQWQGLTDAEIRGFEIWLDDEEEKHGWNPPADIVKYIEAKLKEKNT